MNPKIYNLKTDAEAARTEGERVYPVRSSLNTDELYGFVCCRPDEIPACEKRIQGPKVKGYYLYLDNGSPQ